MKRALTKSAAPIAVFSGWKDIAAYLGKGVRTIQRYERIMGLPIRRPAGKMTGAVLATKGELDAWLSASPLRGTFQTQQTATNFGPLWKDFRKNLQELKRLRHETSALRGQLAESLELLRSNLQLSLDDRHARASSPEILPGGVPLYDSKKIQ